MPDFLLEIGCEEIPARMLDNASRNLRRQFAALLVKEGLVLIPPDLEATASRIQLFATPRRLSILAEGLEAAQRDLSEQVTGPSTNVAFKEGKPTPAAEAFAKKVGVEVSQLQTISTPKGEYLAATVTRKGRTAAEVLAESLPKEITALYWAKTMYWRSGKPERFVRPIRWIVAMLDGQPIPVEFGGIKAGTQSRGHRILNPGSVAIAKPAEYVQTLARANVIAGYSDRVQVIRKALDAATRAVPGARWREDPELLETVANLTEWPSVILGGFDRQFLSLPEEVLVTVMRDHQKYFAVEDESGKLAPYFLAVLNTDGDPAGLIRHGNERVLRARFNDARFFWDFDNRNSFAGRRELLKSVTFQKDLGNYFDKTARMERLVQQLGASINAAGLKVHAAAAAEGARLCKNDLTTELVKEFTELQGIIGGLYASHQGSTQPVAIAIYDHYKPHSAEAAAPRTLEGAAVALADKADSIAGMFALGLEPSGSKDPFALRRQANGIIRILAERKLPLQLSQLLADAREGYCGSEAEKKFTLSGEPYTQSLRAFFRERLDFYLREVLGLAYDVANAALAAGADDVVDAIARAQAVARVAGSPDFESISVAFKRMKNILRQAAETKKRVAQPFDPAVLKEDEEKKLSAAIPQIAATVNKLRAARQYQPALVEISKLRPAVDAFFDKVMVMVEDENLRAQRLGLLQTLVAEFSSIADFSEIVTEGKA